MIELPAHSPESWLAQAYLLSVGIEASEPDTEGFACPHHRRDAYGNESWVVSESWRESLGFGGGWFFEDGLPAVDRGDRMLDRRPPVRMEPFPYDLDIVVRRAPDPTVGDARVSIVGADIDGSARAGSDWQTSVPPLRAEHVNHELTRRFGVVLPFFDSASLPAVHGIAPSRSLITELLEPLAPVRRIALRIHLESVGLTESAPLDGDVARQATQALRALIDVVGPDGTEQDSTTGWLPSDATDRVVADLEWDDVTAAATLDSFARRTRLVRRLKGRVVVTNLGRQLMVDPVHTFAQIVESITSTRDRYWYGSDSSSFDRAAALLALADGSARGFGELAGFAEKAHAARATKVHDECSGWCDTPRHRASADSGRTDSVLRELIDGFLALSAPGAYGVVTPEIRAVAHAALLRG